jgi:chemotaxis protein histidine kinase CheA
MSNDPLNFFVLEAGECLERLDSILANTGATGPEALEFVRYARTLRGAAVVHRLSEFAEVAAGVERAGRALRDGEITWTPALAAALVAAVDDLKILLHNLRIWGPNEQARAARRISDLDRFVTAPHGRAGHPPPAAEGLADSGTPFLAQEASDTADAMEPLIRGGSGPITQAIDASLAHVRTLRGVAAIHDMPPLSDVLDSIERLGRSLTLSHAVPDAAESALIAAAAALLRRAAADLRAKGGTESGTPEEARFIAARDALLATGSEPDLILPVSDLFYSDGRDGVVSRAPSPPTTSAERFRLEVVSLAEHLQGLVRDAQSAGLGPLPEATENGLRSALQSVQRAAESFGERDVSYLLATFTEGHPVFDFLTLHALEELATSLAEQPAASEELAVRVAQLVQGRALDVGIALGLGAPTEVLTQRAKPVAAAPPPAAPAPATRLPGAPAEERSRVRTPTGSQLHAMLADGIAGLGDHPLMDGLLETPAAPLPSTDDGAGLVSIESLLYRGESALARARRLSDALRADPAPAPDTLAELYDLLQLAAHA